MDDTVLMRSLEEEIKAIKKMLDEANLTGRKLNEAETEAFVIDPILFKLGYAPLDISKRSHDSIANNFPDYTLLAGKPQKWFLEAKRMDLNLQDGEAAQAVNYANNQGAEWAVLTNGRTWYIYNAHLPKPLPEKRIFQIADLFSDNDAVLILWLLSKPAMLKGNLGQTWLRQQITFVLQHQLLTPYSEVRKMLRKLSQEVTKNSINEALLTEVLSSFSLPKVDLQQRTTVHMQADTEAILLSPSQPQLLEKQQDDGEPQYTFEEIAKHPAIATKHKPLRLYFQSGVSLAVSTWADAAKEVISREGSIYPLPLLPFLGGRNGKNYFINVSPSHAEDKPMLSYRTAQANDKVIYIDTNRSVGDISACLVAFLRAIQAPIDTVKISIKQK